MHIRLIVYTSKHLVDYSVLGRLSFVRTAYVKTASLGAARARIPFFGPYRHGLRRLKRIHDENC
jgi:hypothetical protein